MKTSAHDIMHQILVTVDPDATIPWLERKLTNAHVSGLPVAIQDRLVGIVSLSDVVGRLCLERDQARINVGLYGAEREDDYVAYDVGKDVADLVGERMDRLRVRDVMKQKVITVSPNTSLDEMAKLLGSHRINRLPVVDNGRLVGLVTSREVIRALASSQEKGDS